MPSTLTWNGSSIAPDLSMPQVRPENDRERQEAAQDQTVATRPGEGVTAGGELQARVTTEQFFESNSGFEPGQGRTQAVMETVAEPEVRPIAAADVEDVGCWEPARVAVGRA